MNRSLYNKWEIERHAETGEYYLQIFCGLSAPMTSKMFSTKVEAMEERSRLNNAIWERKKRGRADSKRRIEL